MFKRGDLQGSDVRDAPRLGYPLKVMAFKRWRVYEVVTKTLRDVARVTNNGLS